MKKPSINIKVLSQKGNCRFGYALGDECTISERGVKGEICIHVLASVLPKAFAMLYEATFPWVEGNKPVTHTCPDVHNPVTFELRRI